jgi:putative FmdB family regulatory protein
MPTYVYRCDACDETFEVFQSFSDKAITTHEGCGGDVKKVFQPSGVVFKGPGFYKTDSRSKTDSGSKGTAGSSTTESSSTAPKPKPSSSSDD